MVAARRQTQEIDQFSQMVKCDAYASFFDSFGGFADTQFCCVVEGGEGGADAGS